MQWLKKFKRVVTVWAQIRFWSGLRLALSFTSLSHILIMGARKYTWGLICPFCNTEKGIARRSPPRHSPPQTFTTSDVHHPLCKIRRSPPQTFTTPDVHHLRRSPPQTFTTPFVKSDVHHPRHSPPQTFTTPYSKMRHSPPTNIHHPLQSSPPKEKFTNRPSIQNVPAVQTTLHPGSRGQSKQWLMIFETVKHGKQWKCLCTPL